MKMTGQSFWFEDGARITDAVLLPTRISIDFVDGGGEGHLDADTTDHVTYVGTYGYKREPKAEKEESQRHVRFDLYKAANGAVLLMGTWRDTKSGDAGNWLIKLTRPSQEG